MFHFQLDINGKTWFNIGRELPPADKTVKVNLLERLLNLTDLPTFDELVSTAKAQAEHLALGAQNTFAKAQETRVKATDRYNEAIRKANEKLAAANENVDLIEAKGQSLADAAGKINDLLEQIEA